MRVLLHALAAVVLLTSAAVAETRTYEVASFTGIEVTDGITALVDVGGSQSVSAEAASASVLNRLIVEVRGERLVLRVDWGPLGFLFNFGRQDEIVVRVSAPVVTTGEASAGANLDVAHMAGDSLSLEASSGAAVDATDVNGAVLDIESSSGANVRASGKCTRLTASASSGAGLDAKDVPCDEVTAEASSGARVSVAAIRAIDADASSGGNVVVHGTPTEIEVDSSSGGSIDFNK